jgi:2-aminobenzoate-CoA ligase
MELTPSAHIDTFARDNLPPRDQWPVIEFTIPEVQYPRILNAATALIDDVVAEVGPDARCLVAPDGSSWTYGQMLARANQIARVLTDDHGVVPGNRVLLRSPNNAWLAASWLAVLKAGAVAVTTMPVLRAAEVGTIVELTTPVVAICDARFREDLDAASTGIAVITFGDGQLEALCDTKDPTFENVPTAADDVALLCPTSGTTGVPKVTMHFHRDILAIADTFARHVLEPTRDDLFAGSPPLAFTFGLGGLLVFPLRFGASTLLTERTTPAELAELVDRLGVTTLFTAPTAYRAIVREGHAALLRGLRVGVSAGEHLPADVWQEVLDECGVRLVNGIGSTEMLHVFVSAAGDDIRPGATGVAVPGYRAALLGDDGAELPAGELGSLGIIGPTGCRYLNDPRQAKYVRGGWNITGDTFTRDEDGYFWYKARSDDMIITSGFNVGAPEVEAAIDLHPDVIENAVIGKPDTQRGSVVCAYVVLREGVEPNESTVVLLQEFVKTKIAPYKFPREIHFVDSLPRNPSGKLQRFRLAEQSVPVAGEDIR